MKTISQSYNDLIGAVKELENNEMEYDKEKGSRETDILSCRINASKNAVIKYTKDFLYYLKEAGIKF